MISTTRPDARNLPEAIQWHEGMLLAPQHFQQMAMRQEFLLGYHAMTMAPFHWGILRFDYDKTLLVGGILRILELEAILPDGLVVILRPDEPEDLEIDLNPFKEGLSGRAMMVHLAVPASRRSTLAVDNDLARYRSTLMAGIIDENTGDGGIEIPGLRPRVVLIAGDTPPARFAGFPLFRVAYRNEIFINDDFVPPMLRVDKSSEIGSFCADVAVCLREKSLSLANNVQDHHFDMGPSEVLEKQAKIQSLVEPLPFLEGGLDTGVSHPYALYLALCMVMGHVATLGASKVPPRLPAYDHNNLRQTFKTLRDLIFATVEEGIWDEFTVFNFTHRNGVFSRRIEESWLGSPLLIGIRGGRGAGEQDVRAWMDEGLIGSEGVMTSLRNRRIRGAARAAVPVGQGLAGRGLLFYEITPDPDFISAGEILQIMNLGERSENVAELSLFVRNQPQEPVR